MTRSVTASSILVVLIVGTLSSQVARGGPRSTEFPAPSSSEDVQLECGVGMPALVGHTRAHDDPFSEPPAIQRVPDDKLVRPRIWQALRGELPMSHVAISARWSVVESFDYEAPAYREVWIDGTGLVELVERGVPAFTCRPLSVDDARGLLKLTLGPATNIGLGWSVAATAGDATATVQSDELAAVFEALAFNEACGPDGWVPSERSCWALQTESGEVNDESESNPGVSIDLPTCSPALGERPCWGIGVRGERGTNRWVATECGKP